MKLYIKLKSQKGAMDKILVTLLLTIVAVVAIIGIEQWSSSKKDELKNQSNNTITKIKNEINQ
ncbi:MAG: hypothetical protein ACNI25_12820 [Halarcobacter sp.]